MKKTLADLSINQIGIIDSFNDLEITEKLLEIGCLPGEKVIIKQKAPFKGPIIIEVTSILIGLRYEEAKQVYIN